jgi:hypothetical protein
MAEKLLAYSVSRFDWWQSENEFLSAGNDFSYSENLNIYESPKYIELSKAFVEIAWFAPTWYITKILRLPNNIQSSAYFSSVWEIYIDSWSWPALVHTLVDADNFILNAICFTSFLLVFTATDIHKIAFTGNDFKTFAACTEAILSYTGDYTWFSTNESKDLPIYNYKDTLLYFWAGNKLYSIGNTLSAVSTSDTFRKGTKMVWFTFLNSSLKIYINYLNVSSELKFWTETQSDGMEYSNRVFKAVESDWQVDYVICTDWLRMYNGVNWTKLFNYNLIDFWKSWSLYYVPQNLICLDPYFVYIAYNKNIFKFWKKFTNIWYWFSISSIEANNITAISDKLTIAWTLYYTGDNKKWYYQWTTYKTTGFFEWIIYFGDSMEKQKKVDRIFNAFDIPTWCSLDFYFSVNWAAYWATPKFSIPTTTEKYRELFANELSNLTYHRIKVKCVLNWSWTATPKVYEFTMLSWYVKNI